MTGPLPDVERQALRDTARELWRRLFTSDGAGGLLALDLYLSDYRLRELLAPGPRVRPTPEVLAAAEADLAGLVDRAKEQMRW